MGCGEEDCGRAGDEYLHVEASADGAADVCVEE